MKLTLATTILAAAMAAAGTAQRGDSRTKRDLDTLLEGIAPERRAAIKNYFVKIEATRDAEIRKLRQMMERATGLLADIRSGQQQLTREAKVRTNRLRAMSRRLELLTNEVVALRATSRGGLPPVATKPALRAPVGELPDALGGAVKRLDNADAGARFEAVDRLVRSKDPKILPHLTPMLEDPDTFVRRLTAEGLGSFQAKAAVDALVPALADAESIVRHAAHKSLRRLTAQDIEFDPNSDADSRTAAQDKWKGWWAKHRAAF